MNLENTVSEAQHCVSNYIQKREEANTLLYKALGHATDLLRQANAGDGSWPRIHAIAEHHGFHDTMNSKKAHLIVRLVFKNLLKELSHDQVYQYARVIDEAYKNGTAGKDVPEWIKSRGGINQIRRKKSNKKGKGGSKPNTYTLDNLKRYVTELFDMGEPDPDTLTQDLPQGEIVAQLGRVDENGTVKVCDTIPVADDETASALLANCHKRKSSEESSGPVPNANGTQDPVSDARSDGEEESVNVETVAAELEPAE